jgi:hypothetical protein
VARVQRLILRTSIGFGLRAPQEWPKNVCVPTFLFQVHDDVLTDPSDVQTMFDNIPVADKKLHWIRGTSARWDGYLEFQRRPEPALEWFENHMPEGGRSGLSGQSFLSTGRDDRAPAWHHVKHVRGQAGGRGVHQSVLDEYPGRRQAGAGTEVALIVPGAIIFKTPPLTRALS